MPFYQEDRRYGNDSRYGLSSATRLRDPLRMSRNKHARYAGDRGLDEEELRWHIEYPNLTPQESDFV
jgi:hypothetical protein